MRRPVSPTHLAAACLLLAVLPAAHVGAGIDSLTVLAEADLEPGMATGLVIAMGLLAFALAAQAVVLVLWKKHRYEPAVVVGVVALPLIAAGSGFAYVHYPSLPPGAGSRLGASATGGIVIPAPVDPFASLDLENISLEIDASILTQGDPVAGKGLFAVNCATCHQPEGQGQPGLAPGVRNPDFLSLVDDGFIIRTVRLGRVGTAMVPRPDLSDEAVADIIAFLRSVDGGAAPQATAEGLQAMGDVQIGGIYFGAYCGVCHGARGGGYMTGRVGPGIGLKGFLSTADDRFIRQTVRNGRAGTSMPSFQDYLRDQEIDHIIAYLRSLDNQAP